MAAAPEMTHQHNTQWGTRTEEDFFLSSGKRGGRVGSSHFEWEVDALKALEKEEQQALAPK